MTPEELERLLAAFRRDEEYIDALSDELYLAKLRVYTDTLSGLAGTYGYEADDVSVSTQIAQALSDEADDHAEKIAATYNRELENLVRRMGALGLTYEQAVNDLAEWSDQRDESRAEMISVSEAYPAHADATLAFFIAIGIEPMFDFGGHNHDLPSACPVCIRLEETNPHELADVLRVGTPHINCRQNWHPLVDEGDLPDEIELGLGEVAGIVGGTTFVQQQGGTNAAAENLGGDQ